LAKPVLLRERLKNVPGEYGGRSPRNGGGKERTDTWKIFRARLPTLTASGFMNYSTVKANTFIEISAPSVYIRGPLLFYTNDVVFGSALIEFGVRNSVGRPLLRCGSPRISAQR